MNAKKTLFMVALVAVMMLSSCSGINHGCVTNCGGGDALLNVTISDTPPTNTSVTSFTLPIIGIALVPSAGGQTSVFSTGNFELTRLQSDTGLIAANVKVAAGTYTAVNVTVSAPYGSLINSSGVTVGTCLAGNVCPISGSAATISYTFTTPLVLTANANQWLNLDFNYNNAIVTTNGGIDVTQTGVMTAKTTVPNGVASGNFANIDDFTGQVTAVSSTSITLKSQLRGTLTASLPSTLPVFDPLNQCTGGGSLSCIAPGSVVSMQGLLSNAGVLTATSLDIIDISTTAVDEIEGIIYPSTCNGGSNYGIVLSDSVVNTSGSPLASAKFGDGICLTLNQAIVFGIDTGILTGQPGVPTNNVGFLGTGDILTGQMVRAKITNATTGTNGINANATALILRFSRITGKVATTGTIFTVNGLPLYLGSFNVPPQVQTYINATLFEGITDPNSLVVGQTVSFRALYLDTAPTFQAAKVRTF
jgi:hypothetical protein